ncbi:putative C6 transcription factor [Fonsecaea pedrosoi]|nr:putative C6 transcription factor [Fonsecaea pedrosoi]
MAITTPGQQMSEPERRRRRRPAVSCTVCRKRKIRCNREHPCNNCTRSRDAVCIYEDFPPLRQRPHTEEPAASDGQTSPGSTGKTSSITSSAATAPHDTGTPVSTNIPIDSLMIEGPPMTSDQSQDISSAPLTLELPDPAQCRQDFFGEPRISGRTVFHKSRQFGQSHWMNGVSMFGGILHLIESRMRKEPTVIPAGMRRCKALAKVIKSARMPVWPTPLSDDLPARDVVEHLIDNYLRTIESVYRIIHIPTFRKHVEALWTLPQGGRRDTAFMVQLKLILAIGATYDETFSLRTSAMRWVYEAQTWLNTPNSKIRLNVQSLQINVLLIVARELVDVCGDLTWISAGELYRRAIYMGLNRDHPSPVGSTVFATEMRRRLWNTVLEICLQASMASGGPVLVSMDDFDTKPPSNLDDVQLEEKSPAVKPENVYTQVSTAIALRKSFAVRLAVVKFLNDLRVNGRYEHVLQLDGEMRTAYKTLTRTLQNMLSSSSSSSSSSTSSDGFGRPGPNTFELMTTDLMMNRYLLTVHIPFFEQSMHEATYAYTRKVVLESSLKMWYVAYRSSSEQAGAGASGVTASLNVHTPSPGPMACGGPGYGFYPVYRSGLFQASCLVAAELCAQLEEQDGVGMGFTPLRPDLLPVVQEAKTWCYHGMQIGETNIKGYVFSCLIAAQVDALMRGMDKDDIPKFLLQSAEEAMRESIAVLEEQAGVGNKDTNTNTNANGNGNGDGRDLTSSLGVSTVGFEALDESAFMTPDGMFDFGDTGAMEWGFNNNNNINDDDEFLADVSFW